ncbi:MAG: hypothetical protein KBT69_10980 [Oceanihabitans sp.]|nr:hypothetical protein [Oceanihabitans sp.]
MSITSYKKIFSIKITHDYFDSSFAESVNLTVGKETQRLVSLYNIKLRIVGYSCSLFINSETSTEDFLNYLESVTSTNYFDFNIHIVDSSFYNYTNISFNSNPSYLYESNASGNSLDTNTTLLNPKVDTVSLNNEFAIIKIYFQDIMEAPSEGQDFLIAFRSRATLWQYYIINRTAINLSSPSIQGNSDVSFSGPKQVTLQNGQQAIVFTSNQPLKLSQTPKYTFDLMDVRVENNQVISKKIFSGLPHPNAGQLEISTENGNPVFSSPMYIYV